MFWQVWVPLVLSIVIALSCGILAIFGAAQGNPKFDNWGAVATIIVIIPQMVFSLISLAIFGGLAYLVYYLLKYMPGWMLKAQLFMLQVALTVRRVADTVAKPVIATGTFTTRVTTLWDRLFNRRTAV